MSINLKEAVLYLLRNGYLIQGARGKYKVTQKLYDGMVKGEIFSNPTPTNQELAAYIPHVDWTKAYTTFIITAQVPARGESRNGEFYPLNKYSEPGMKAFRKAIEIEGVNLDILIKSTMLYYKSGVKLKVAITRYMEEGLWRSDYEALVNSAEEGRIEEHIKQQLNDGQHSDWTVG